MDPLLSEAPSSKKKILAMLAVAILLLAIPFGVKLVQQQQEIRSKASASNPINFIGEEVKCEASGCTTKSSTVKVELTSPFGPPEDQTN